MNFSIFFPLFFESCGMDVTAFSSSLDTFLVYFGLRDSIEFDAAVLVFIAQQIRKWKSFDLVCNPSPFLTLVRSKVQGRDSFLQTNAKSWEVSIRNAYPSQPFARFDEELYGCEFSYPLQVKKSLELHRLVTYFKKLQQFISEIHPNHIPVGDATKKPSSPWRRKTYLRNIGEINSKIKEEEDRYRKAIASESYSFEKVKNTPDDPNQLLIDVFKNIDTFKTKQHTFKKCRLINFSQGYNLFHPHIENEFATFQSNFNLLTENLFLGFDWENVFVAGGAVLACLLQGYEYQKDFKNKIAKGANGFLHTDIDLFIYGLSATAATEKVQKILQFFTRKNPGKLAPGHIILSNHSITLLGMVADEVPNFQIILRLYQSISEIIIGFDIDCCAVGFDGKLVWAIPRSQRAISNQTNLVDLSRRSYTYEDRLIKYLKRGFTIAVPGLNPKTTEVFYTNKKKGLGKIITASTTLKTETPAIKKMKREVFIDELTQYVENKEYEKGTKMDDDFDLQGAFKKFHIKELPPQYQNLDYSVKIPWFCVNEGLLKLNYNGKDIKEYRYKTGKFHLCKFTDQNWNEFIQKQISWITVNPGKQGLFTGSFYPIQGDLHWELEPRLKATFRFNESLPLITDEKFMPHSINISDLNSIFHCFKHLKDLLFQKICVEVLTPILRLDIARMVVDLLPREDWWRLALTCRTKLWEKFFKIQQEVKQIYPTEKLLLENQPPLFCKRFLSYVN
jgi:hypothetical protein